MAPVFARLHIVHCRKLDAARARLLDARADVVRQQAVVEQIRMLLRRAEQEVTEALNKIQDTLTGAVFLPEKIPSMYRDLEFLRDNASRFESELHKAMSQLEALDVTVNEAAEAVRRQQARTSKIDSLANVARRAAASYTETLAEIAAEDDRRHRRS